MFINRTITKKVLETIIHETFLKFGSISSSALVDSLKLLGFYYATNAGISINIEDLKTPNVKDAFLDDTLQTMKTINKDWQKGLVSDIERFQTIIDSWNVATESLKNKIIDYYQNFDPANNLYIMAFSGARGNMSQVRQLVGMRGLMSDQDGKIIDLPIQTNFREGLSSIDYIISSYGARKGIVDTALKTADSGYLTRRLIYVAQDLVIRQTDCKTKKGLIILLEKKSSIKSLIGRTILSATKINKLNNISLFENEFLLTQQTSKIILHNIPLTLNIRSSLTCAAYGSICQKCYGWDLAQQTLISLGEAVGIIAAQSIGEPGTQLTMRTFHTGGIFTGETVKQIVAPFSGKLIFPDDLKSIHYRTNHGQIVLKLKQESELRLIDWTGKIQILSFEIGSYLYLYKSDFVQKGQLIAEHSAQTITLGTRRFKPVYTLEEGEILFGKNLNFCIDEETKYKEIFINNEKKKDKVITKNLIKKQTNIIEKNGAVWLLTATLFYLPLESFFIFSTSLKQRKPFAKMKVCSPVKGVFVEDNLEKRFLILKNSNFEEKQKKTRKSNVNLHFKAKGLLTNLKIINNISIYNLKQKKNLEFTWRLFLKSNEKIKENLLCNIQSKSSIITLKTKKYKEIYEQFKLNLQKKRFALFKLTNKINKIENRKTKLFTKLKKKITISESKEKKNVKKQQKFLNLKLPIWLPFEITKKNENVNDIVAFIPIVKNYQSLEIFSTIGYFYIFPKTDTTIYSLKQQKIEKEVQICLFSNNNNWLFHLEEPEQVKSIWSPFFFFDVKHKKKQENGCNLSSTLFPHKNGLFLKREGGKIFFHNSCVYRLSYGTTLKYETGDFLQKKTLLANLINYTQQTEDIVQGLPKIEELIEARISPNLCLLCSQSGILIEHQKTETLLKFNFSEKRSKQKINHLIFTSRRTKNKLNEKELKKVGNSISILSSLKYKDISKSLIQHKGNLYRPIWISSKFNLISTRIKDKNMPGVNFMLELGILKDLNIKNDEREFPYTVKVLVDKEINNYALELTNEELKKKSFFDNSNEDMFQYYSDDILQALDDFQQNLNKNEQEAKDLENKISNELLSEAINTELLEINKTISRFKFTNSLRKSWYFWDEYNAEKTRAKIKLSPTLQILKTTNTNFPHFLIQCLEQENLGNIFLEYQSLKKNYFIPSQKTCLFEIGDFIDLGEPLTEGNVDIHNLLKILTYHHVFRDGVQEGNIRSLNKFQLLLVNSIQAIYQSQGVSIANKHIEIVVRQMTAKVSVVRPGITPFLPGEFISLSLMNEIYETIKNLKKKTPKYIPKLLSATNSSLRKESFLSAAGFQETKRVLTKAAIEGKSDWLRGLKESIIVGRLTPSGSTFLNYKNHLDSLYYFKK